VLAYIVLGLVALLIVLVALALFAPVSFAGEASVSVELRGDGLDQSGLLYLAALDPDLDLDDLGLDGDAMLDYSASVRGSARVLWGLLAVSEDGVRLLGFPVARFGAGGKPRGKATPDAGSEVSSQPAAPARLADGRAAKDPPRRGRRFGGRVGLRDLQRIWPGVRHAMARSWQALRLRLRVGVTLGLEDPAATGILAAALPAALGPAIWSINARRQGSVAYRFTPAFDREVMAAEVSLAGDTNVAGLVWPWIRLALRRDVRALWWPRRRKRPG
jgi:hypothetical protein